MHTHTPLIRSTDCKFRYFPTQPGKALDNLKEGFEIGSGKVKTAHASSHHGGPFSLYEPNVWPSSSNYFPAASRRRVTQLYGELQALSAQLLSLLALSLNKPANNFTHWLDDSLSTLRLLHYPPVESPRTIVKDDDASSITSGSERSTTSTSEDSSSLNVEADDKQIPTIAAMDDEATTGAKLSCTPHTDSGILTLLHQDPTGGLEVLNSSDQWIAAPYIPNTIVVNIGDLMAKVSGGRWVATMHRVRAPRKKVAEEGEHGAGFGRFSVPFFFEPGEECLVRDLDGEGAVRYGDHVRAKMKTWVEFQGDNDDDDESG